MIYEARSCGSEWCPRGRGTPEEIAQDFVLDLSDDDTRDGVVSVQVRAVFEDGSVGAAVDYRVSRRVLWVAEPWGEP